MRLLRISEVADRTGVPPSTLRFYEKAGIVVPDRADNGYRAYSTTDVDRLDFLVRAKAVGLTLDEAAELLDLRDRDECGPVQDRLTALVRGRMTDARSRVTELSTFADELESLVHQLVSRRPDGPCDDDCGCLTSDPEVAPPQPVRFGARPTVDTPSALIDVCSLDRSMLPKRLGDWQRLLSRCEIKRASTVVVAELPADVDLAGVADLVAAETECCSFFQFRIDVDADGRRLTIEVPDDRGDALTALLGPAA